MHIIKKISLLLLILLYAAAGINHFWHPSFYINIIPPYLPHPIAINILAGMAEFIAAILLIFAKTRNYGLYLIIFLLIVFIPTHIYMIELAYKPNSSIPLWLAWVRLIPVQFLLILWAYWHLPLKKTVAS